MQADAAILLSLLFDLADADYPDFAGRAHMCSATGLEIDIADADQPDLSLPHGRLDLHGLDQIGLSLKLGIGDPFGANREVGINP